MNQKEVNKYVSLETALSYHGILPQETFSDTYIFRESSKPKNLDARISETLPDNLFFGFYKLEGKDIWIAEPEKAFLDLVYYKNLREEEIDFEQFDLSLLSPSKLDDYSKKMGLNYRLLIKAYLNKYPVPSRFGYEIPKDLAA